MAPEGVKRKISAILSADVVGYSKLMEADEETTVRTMESYRRTFTSLIEQHDGHVIDSPGDNILSEFGSVVDAVQCAVEVQHTIEAKNAGLPEIRRMEFRIGINLGDVIEEEDRTYGSGINIASRIEGIADAGGICISESAYQQIKSKLSFGYEDLGEQSLKNIADPIRVYRIPLGSGGSVEAGKAKGVVDRKWRNSTIALSIVVVLIVGLAAVLYLRSYTPSTEVAAPKKAIAPIKKAESFLAWKPSIAVLPFTNMSDDPKQEYFVDGMTEDIITRLSMFPYLAVISRNSTFFYKGKQIRIRQVGEELGARYVLEGSVRKAGSRVRITAQLINAETDEHLWAETYDRDMVDIFAIQDEIAKRIVSSLLGPEGGILAAEKARVRRMPTENLTAYDAVLKSDSARSTFTEEGVTRAIELLERAIELDPEFALAYARLGSIYHSTYIFSGRRGEDHERAFELIRRAISLDDAVPGGHATLGNLYRFKGQYDLALAEIDRAISLNPNSPWAYTVMCSIHNELGRPEEALEAIEKAMQLDPHYGVGYLTELAWAYNGLGRYEDAIASLNEAIAMNPDYVMIYLVMAGAYAGAGQGAESLRTLEDALDRHPEWVPISEELMRAYRRRGGFGEATATGEAAIARNPDIPGLYYEQAWVYLDMWTTQQNEDPHILDKALEFAEKTVSMDEDATGGHYTLSVIYLNRKQYEQAISEAEKTIAIAPEAGWYSLLGHVYNHIGRSKDAIALAEKALQFVPKDIGSKGTLAHAYRLASRLEDAVAIQEQFLGPNPGFTSWGVRRELTILYSELGRMEEAKAEAAELLRLLPHFSVDVYGKRIPYKDPAQTERDMAALRKAGLE